MFHFKELQVKSMIGVSDPAPSQMDAANLDPNLMQNPKRFKIMSS